MVTYHTLFYLLLHTHIHRRLRGVHCWGFTNFILQNRVAYAREHAYTYRTSNYFYAFMTRQWYIHVICLCKCAAILHIVYNMYKYMYACMCWYVLHVIFIRARMQWTIFQRVDVVCFFGQLYIYNTIQATRWNIRNGAPRAAAICIIQFWNMR